MSSAPFISVEDYLSRTEKPSCEYIDGVLPPKSRATTLHGIIQVLLIVLLRQQGLKAPAEVTIRLSESRFLIPDIIAVPQIDRPYPTKPVTLCVEILSPDDRLSETLNKCEQYHQWGVPFCWVLDPVQQTAWQCDSGKAPQQVERSGSLRVGDVFVNCDKLFAASENK